MFMDKIVNNKLSAFLAIHGHDVVLKKMLDFGDVYIIDILIPQNDSFWIDVFN